MSSSRYSAGPPAAPHDASNRSRDYSAHGSATIGMPRGGEVSRSASTLHMYPLQHEFQMQSHHVVEAEAPRSSLRQPSGQYRAEFASHGPIRMYRSGSSSLSLQPRRDGPLSALASFEQGSGTTSRYTQSVSGCQATPQHFCTPMQKHIAGIFDQLNPWSYRAACLGRKSWSWSWSPKL